MRYRYDINKGILKIKTKATLIITALGLVLGGGGLSLALVGTAQAAPSVIYNNIASPQPGNVSSVSYEATGTSEFGGQVQFAGTNRHNPTVTVLMSSWGCQTGNWNLDNCVTTPGATFTEPITLNVYNVNPDNSPGSVVATTTQTFTIPYRPSASASCTEAQAGEWSNGTSCFNGLATPISFSLNGVTLPNTAIISVAYNTTNYGYAPIGSSSCSTTQAGCGYDSLNVGVDSSLTAGTDPTPLDAYQDTLYDSCTNGAVTPFGIDTGCWGSYQPAIEVSASSAITLTAPHITSPHNGATVLTTQLNKVTWTKSHVTPPVTYQYQSFYNASYTTLAYSSGWLTTNQIPTTGTPAGVYYLQVRVQDGNGNMSNWSNGAGNPYKITVVSPVPPPITIANCQNNGWKTYNDPSFKNKDQCIDYVVRHSHSIKGDVTYTANGLKREADFNMNTADNSGTFNYSDANHGSYKVKVSSIKVSGNTGWFAGVVTKASTPSWVGQWLFAEVKNGKPDQIWGSFTTQIAAQTGVTNMTNPADGPFNVTKGNLEVH